MTDLHRDFEAVLPVTLESIHAATLDDRLHVVGVDERRVGRHMVMEGGADALQLSAADIPFVEVVGIAAGARDLVVCGVTAGDGASVLRLDRDGSVAWASDTSVDVRFRQWPRPVAAAGALWLFATTARPRPTVRMVRLDGDRLAAPLVIDLPDDTDTVDVCGDAAGVLVARVHGDPARLEVLSIVEGDVTGRVELDAVRPTAPAVAAAGGRIAVAWVTEPGEPHLAWLDAGLTRLAAPNLIALPSLGAVRRVRPIARLDGTLAIAFHSTEVAGDAEIVHAPSSARSVRPPRQIFPLHAAAYDTDAHRLGPLHLVERHAHLFACAWLRDILVVVHRGRDTRASFYTVMP